MQPESRQIEQQFQKGQSLKLKIQYDSLQSKIKLKLYETNKRLMKSYQNKDIHKITLIKNCVMTQKPQCNLRINHFIKGKKGKFLITPELNIKCFGQNGEQLSIETSLIIKTNHPFSELGIIINSPKKSDKTRQKLTQMKPSFISKQNYKIVDGDQNHIISLLKNNPKVLYTLFSPYNQKFIKQLHQFYNLGGVYIYPKLQLTPSNLVKTNDQYINNAYFQDRLIIDSVQQLQKVLKNKDELFYIGNLEYVQPFVHPQKYDKLEVWKQFTIYQKEQCFIQEPIHTITQCRNKQSQIQLLSQYYYKYLNQLSQTSIVRLADKLTDSTRIQEKTEEKNDRRPLLKDMMHKLKNDKKIDNIVFYLQKKMHKKIYEYQRYNKISYSHCNEGLNNVIQQLINKCINNNPVEATQIVKKLYEIVDKQKICRDKKIAYHLEKLYQQKIIKKIKQNNKQALFDPHLTSKQISQNQFYVNNQFKKQFLCPDTFLRFFAILYTSQTVYKLLNQTVAKFQFQYISELTAYLIEGVQILIQKQQIDQVPQGTILYRGISTQDDIFNQEQTSYFPAFTSTSTNKDRAKNFIINNQNLIKRQKKYIYNIQMISDDKTCAGRKRKQWVINMSKLSIFNEYQCLILPGFPYTQKCRKSNQIAKIQNRKYKFDQIEIQQKADKFISQQIRVGSQIKECTSINFSNRPQQIDQIPNFKLLQRLWFCNNKYKKIPQQILMCNNLTHLWLNNNHIQQLPNNRLFKKLCNLKNVYLNKNQLKQIVIDKNEKLEHLQIRENNLQRVIIKAQNLETLDLSMNKLKENKLIIETPKLQILYLKHNNLAKIDNNIYKNNKIIQIYLDDNCIQKIPQQLLNLVNLKVISLNSNLINIFQVKLLRNNIKEIRLANNNITTIPQQILQTTLQRLILHISMDNLNQSQKYKIQTIKKTNNWNLIDYY